MSDVKRDDVKHKAPGTEASVGPATIYDVATEAGVSISTVSLALNAPDRVKPATLDRIMSAVDRLGYTPKVEAVIRARRGMGRVGVIGPFTSFPTETGRRLAGIMAAVAEHGHEIVVFDQASAATSRLMSLPVTRKVDGLIIVSVPFDDDVERRLRERRTPSVVVEIPHRGVTSVIIDHRAGGAMVGRFLTDRGHRRIAYVGHRQQHDYPSQSRLKLEGLASSLPDAPIVHNVEHSLSDAAAAGRELLASADRPTGVFAHDDLLAAGILMAARELGLVVPDDVAVVGFNDTDVAAPLGLTTVRQPFEQSGRIAAQLLLEQIADPDVGQRTLSLGVEIIERRSA